MKIFVLCDSQQKDEILTKGCRKDIEFSFFEDWNETPARDYDAFFILSPSFIENSFSLQKDKYMKTFRGRPVVLSSTIQALQEWEAPHNFMRICGWNSFLKREIWEVAGDEKVAKELFENLQWQYKMVKDTPGFIAARVISMIINEAHYALKEKVSTKEEINMAMKLGTNYPYGPFEWEEILGAKNVHLLLEKLAKADSKYLPAFTPH